LELKGMKRIRALAGFQMKTTPDAKDRAGVGVLEKPQRHGRSAFSFAAWT
jgi:hypothetical protein